MKVYRQYLHALLKVLFTRVIFNPWEFLAPIFAAVLNRLCKLRAIFNAILQQFYADFEMLFSRRSDTCFCKCKQLFCPVHSSQFVLLPSQQGRNQIAVKLHRKPLVVQIGDMNSLL